MGMRKVKARHKQIATVIFGLMFILILGTYGMIKVGVYLVESVSTSLEENDTTLSREFGKTLGDMKSEFQEGVEESKED